MFSLFSLLRSTTRSHRLRAELREESRKGFRGSPSSRGGQQNMGIFIRKEGSGNTQKCLAEKGGLLFTGPLQAVHLIILRPGTNPPLKEKEAVEQGLVGVKMARVGRYSFSSCIFSPFAFPLPFFALSPFLLFSILSPSSFLSAFELSLLALMVSYLSFALLFAI